MDYALKRSEVIPVSPGAIPPLHLESELTKPTVLHHPAKRSPCRALPDSSKLDAKIKKKEGIKGKKRSVFWYLLVLTQHGIRDVFYTL